MNKNDSRMPTVQSGQKSGASATKIPDTADRHMARLLRYMHNSQGRPRSNYAHLRGRALGRYLVLGELGSGGMGTVLKAYDESLDRAIAIKLLHSDTTDHHAKRLRREAQALAKLSHPNVVHVYEVVHANDQWFIAMEMITGQTLREWQREERAWRECIKVYILAGEGLAAAHAAGLVHRDFKPDNCIIDKEGRPRVLDFGLVAQDLPAGENLETLEIDDMEAMDTPLTSTGTVMGTPAYMPPEQMRGEEADVRSDQFSFCVALYEALYGERPYDGKTWDALMESVRLGVVGRKPRGTMVPAKVRQILLRGIAVDPLERWSSMDELLAELRRVVSPRQRRWLAIGVAAGMVAIGVGLTRLAEVGFVCRGSQAHLESTWGEVRRLEVEQAILGTGVGHAPEVWKRLVEPELDHYADSWANHREEACKATRFRQEQSTEVMDLRIACLDRAKMEMAAVTNVLANADQSVVDRAHEVLGSLLPLSRCTDVKALQADVEPPMPQEVAVVESIRGLLAEARAERKAGRYARAQVRMEDAKLRHVDVEYGPIRTERALEEGLVLEALGEYGASKAALQEALRLASRWHQWRELQQAASLLMIVVGFKQRHMEEGLWYRDLAEQLAVGDRLAQAQTWGNLGTILYAQGKYAEAEREYRRAFARIEETDATEFMKLGNSLAAAFAAQGKIVEAERQIREVLELGEETLGPEHPMVAKFRSNLGNALWALKKYAEAEKVQRHALASREKALGPAHPDVAESLNNLSVILEHQRKYEEAEALQRQALKTRKRVLEHDHPFIGTSHYNLAGILLERGHAEQALPFAELAWSRNRRDDIPIGDRASTAVVLAKALWEVEPQSRSRARALILAHGARKIYEKLGATHAAEAEDLREWLAGHDE